MLAAYSMSSRAMGVKEPGCITRSMPGVFNEFIMERLSQKIPCAVQKENNYEALEALSFAILGYYTLQGVPSNVPNVTGASRPAVLGNITDPIIRGRI